MYLPLIVADGSRPDYLATVDVDPASPTYSQAQHAITGLSLTILYGIFCLVMSFACTMHVAMQGEQPHCLALWKCHRGSVLGAGHPPAADAPQGRRVAPLRLERMQQLPWQPQQVAQPARAARPGQWPGLWCTPLPAQTMRCPPKAQCPASSTFADVLDVAFVIRYDESAGAACHVMHARPWDMR